MIHRYVQRDKKVQLSQETLWTVLKRPIITEKSTQLNAQGKYVFEVASWANKIHIARAVEKIFSVKVLAINTLNVKGKTRIFRGKIGKCADRKKAIVSLGEGVVLDFEKGLIS